MAKARNIVFAILTSLILLCVFGCKAAGNLNILPSFLDNTKHSYLEGRDLKTAPPLSNETIGDKSFQDDVEEYIADSVPARDSILLANAALERSVIRIANSLFAYEAYPTFFESDQNESLDRTHIFWRAYNVGTDVSTESMAAFGKSLSAFSESNPDIKVVLCLIDDIRTSPINPTYSYVSNPLTESAINESLISNLSPNIILIRPLRPASLAEYDRYYLPTDHHWSVNGMRVAYEALAAELGWESIEQAETLTYDSYPFCGQGARTGRDLIADIALGDINLDLSDLSYSNDDGDHSYGHRDQYRSGRIKNGNETFYNGYGYLYGGNWRHIDVSCRQPVAYPNDEAILLTDSFGTFILPFIARNYSVTHKYDVVNSKQTAGLLQNAVDATGSKTVIILTRPSGTGGIYDKNAMIFD